MNLKGLLSAVILKAISKKQDLTCGVSGLECQLSPGHTGPHIGRVKNTIFVWAEYDIEADSPDRTVFAGEQFSLPQGVTDAILSYKIRSRTKSGYRKACLEVHAETSMMCTLEVGHPGPHVATAYDVVGTVWGEADETLDLVVFQKENE